MSSTKDNLVRLCVQMAEHQGVMHWAISMRIFKKGDFFGNLINGTRRGCHVDTAERTFQWFSDNWPEDLAWPSDVPRPDPTQNVRKTA